MDINIYQGSSSPERVADVTVVIDVIRAFTVAHYAFIQGVKKILLAETVEEALKMKGKNSKYLLAGEVNGLPIEGFDLDNSPYHLKQKNLAGKTLVQKTTNGVRATLNCLSSQHVFVTGFTNARTTSEFIKTYYSNEIKSVNIVASHPTGDDDLACAEYIKSLLKGDESISAGEVIQRIKQSHVAAKFFDENNPAFVLEDIFECTRELDTNFVMKINRTGKTPTIERVKEWQKQIWFYQAGKQNRENAD